MAATKPLTKEQEAFLEECEAEFHDRFSQTDIEFKQILDKGIPNPPIMVPWNCGRPRYNNSRYRGNNNHRENNYNRDNRWEWNSDNNHNHRSRGRIRRRDDDDNYNNESAANTSRPTFNPF